MTNNLINKTENNSFANNDFNYLLKKWSNKINNFHVLVVYSNESNSNDKNLLKLLYENMNKEKIINVPIFQETIEAETFIIGQQAYHENKGIFLKLRLNARNIAILRIARVIVVYLLSRYEALQLPQNNHPVLKETKFIDQLIQKYHAIVKNETFLADSNVWDNFHKWLKDYYTGWILEDMIKNLGENRLEKLDENELNELFNTFLTKNLSQNSQLIINTTNIVNSYMQNWIAKILTSLDIENVSLEKILKLLDLENPTLDQHSNVLPRKDITLTIIENGNIYVMSNAAYQSVRESLSNKLFKSYKDMLWPTAEINKGALEGIVQIKPDTNRVDFTIDHQTLVQESWSQAKELTELDVDVFDALCSFFLSKAKHHKDIVEIHLDDLLSIRGLKSKLGGSGRRGGYEIKQRETVWKALSLIQNLWIDLDKVIVYEKGRPVQMKLQGRAFLFFDKNRNEYYIGDQLLEKKLYFTVDEVFAKFLYGSGRQVALLPVKALQYNPYKEAWEKKLTRYFSWRWRTQARKGEYLQPYKISSLMDAIGKKVDERSPSRTRERLEKALDLLQEDGIITSWQYEKWEESFVLNNGWARIWGNSNIIVDPPVSIKEQYMPIEKRQKQNKFKAQNFSDKSIDKVNIGEQIKYVREKLCLTLLQAAEQLEISASYLSNIERGLKIPSNKIKKRIKHWMHLHELNN